MTLRKIYIVFTVLIFLAIAVLIFRGIALYDEENESNTYTITTTVKNIEFGRYGNSLLTAKLDTTDERYVYMTQIHNLQEQRSLISDMCSEDALELTLTNEPFYTELIGLIEYGGMGRVVAVKGTTTGYEYAAIESHNEFQKSHRIFNFVFSSCIFVFWICITFFYSWYNKKIVSKKPYKKRKKT